MATKMPTQILLGYQTIPEGRLQVAKTAVQQYTHYGRAVFTGNTGFPVDSNWNALSVLSLLVPQRDEITERFWHPAIQERLPELGWSGHLVRLWDSCLRLGLAPDPQLLGLDVDINHPDYWPKVLLKLAELVEEMLRMNAASIILGGLRGDFDRIYIRVYVFDPGTGVGPTLPDWRNSVKAGVTLIAQPFGVYARPGAVLVPAVSEYRSPSSGIKTVANYLPLEVSKAAALEDARTYGIEADDVYNFSGHNIHGVILGEASTSTIGCVFHNGQGPQVIVPDPVVSGTLPGLTAAWAIRLARELGMRADYGVVTVAAFAQKCAEAFRGGNASGISYIGAIGTRELQHAVVDQLSARYQELLRREIHPECSTIVSLTD